MAAMSLSMPESFLCSVIMPVRSILSSSVCSRTLFLSSIHVTVSLHSMWKVWTPWAEPSSSLLPSAFSRRSAQRWFSWFWRPASQ